MLPNSRLCKTQEVTSYCLTIDPSVKWSNGEIQFWFPFGYSETFVNGTTTYNISNCTRISVGSGKNNTKLLVESMGAKANTTSGGGNNSPTPYYAAKCCYDLSLIVDGVVYADWFLPSKGELNLMYTNLKKKNLLGNFYRDNKYLSSSEYSENPKYVWVQAFDEIGNQEYATRYAYMTGFYSVRPIRAF